MSKESIVVKGARVHNLRNIDFEVPHNELTVVTGVSGSGKSSLAFDTIYAEGQRRYVESLSAYARQFLERIEKPDVDVIEGIAPAVAIRQKNSTRNPRSTVATATEIYDYLRLLFARVGRTYCLQCGKEVKKDTVDEIATAVLEMPAGTRLNVLFPVQTAEAGSRGIGATTPSEPKKKTTKTKKAAEEAAAALHAELLKSRLFELRKRGFNRLWQGGQVFEFSSPESLLDVNFAQPVFALVDRLVVSADSAETRARLVDAVESCYREAGEIVLETAPREGEAVQRLRFAQRFECKTCGIRYEEPEPRLFSFNNPYGACPRCQGFGNTIDFDMGLVIPDPSKSLADGAIEPWTKPKYRVYYNELKKVAKDAALPLHLPWNDLSEEQQEFVMTGGGRFGGVRGFFAYLERKKYKLHVRVFLSRYRGYSVCPDCNGTRLRAEARTVRVGEKNICDVCALTVEGAAKLLGGVQLTAEQTEIADKILHEISERLRFLIDVGLEYLTLDRLSSTLSGGEAQRIQLATSLGSRLVGTLYVLDEPSIGLHSRDTHRLIKILEGLRDLGNTILVVEHDAAIMRSAGHILDMGPGAGEHGGRVVASGTYDDILAHKTSLTGRYLAGDLRVQLPTQRREPGKRRIQIRGAQVHNLKKIDVAFPLEMLVAVTGVSGSGKSSLVHDVLYPSLAAAKKQAGPTPPTNCREIEGEDFLDEIILVDQSPIGRTPRSNPVTYTKAFDGIRDLYASIPDAKKKGLSAGHFSFNIPGGRCDTCQGDGTVTVEMQFLADVELVCEECHGTRYKPQVLEIKYKGKNIHEALNLTVKESLQFFAGVPKIVDKLRVLDEVGLSYLRLGQSASTLSGGEAQRMKLAAHLQPAAKLAGRPKEEIRKHRWRTLYIFDEPTTGLHFDDVSKLLAAFRRLIDAGGSIVVIEHNLEVIKTADWVIDLGPEGGARGGEVVAVGTPEEIARNPKSYTGGFLKQILEGRAIVA